jgi:hypothetical protein
MYYEVTFIMKQNVKENVTKISYSSVQILISILPQKIVIVMLILKIFSKVYPSFPQVFTLYSQTLIRGVAQPGSAPYWGCGGRRFKSSRPDQNKRG